MKCAFPTVIWGICEAVNTISADMVIKIFKVSAISIKMHRTEDDMIYEDIDSVSNGVEGNSNENS